MQLVVLEGSGVADGNPIPLSQRVRRRNGRALADFRLLQGHAARREARGRREPTRAGGFRPGRRRVRLPQPRRPLQPCHLRLARDAPRVRYVLSDDIRTREEAFRIGPGETLDLGDLSVRALRSTDAGAAFLVRTAERRFFTRATSTGGTGTARRIPTTRGWRATTAARSTPCAGEDRPRLPARRPAPGGQVPLGDRLFHARGGRRYGGADAPVGTVRPHRPPARGGDGRAPTAPGSRATPGAGSG